MNLAICASIESWSETMSFPEYYEPWGVRDHGGNLVFPDRAVMINLRQGLVWIVEQCVVPHLAWTGYSLVGDRVGSLCTKESDRTENELPTCDGLRWDRRR